MSTIAARLGGSKATLYTYFKPKEDLFSAVVRRFSCLSQRQLDSFPEGCMAEDSLEQLLSPDAIALSRLVVGESDRFPELARLFYDAGPKIKFMRSAEFLGEMMELGQLRLENPFLAAEQFNGLVLCGIYLQRLWGVIEAPTPAMVSEHANAAVDTFLRAYAPGVSEVDQSLRHRETSAGATRPIFAPVPIVTYPSR